MPTLVSNVITVTINGTQSAQIAPPAIVLTTAEAGQTATFTRGTYREDSGAYQQRWGYEPGVLIPGATGISFVIPDTLIGKLLYVEERPANANGPVPNWYKSNTRLIAAAGPSQVWTVSGSIILTNPQPPAAPSVVGTVVSA